MIDRLSKSPSMFRFFNKLLMHLEHCNPSQFELLNNDGPIRPSDVPTLSLLASGSNFLREKVVRRLNQAMLHSDDPTAIVTELISITGSDIEVEFVVRALAFANPWRFTLDGDLSFVLYCCKARFFAHAILMKIERRFNNNIAFSEGESAPTPERRILCEIAYQHRDMTSAVFRIASSEISKRSRSSAQNDALAVSEVLEVCFFTFRLGRGIEFVRLLGRDRLGEPALRRKFILYVLRDSRPPFSPEFLSELLAVLTKPMIKALFFPEMGRQATGALAAALGVLVQFTECLNRDNGTRTKECDARPYNELRKQAQRALDLARGTGQPTIRSFM
jgi:hypothetical protein